jgi:Glycine rich protein
MATPIGIPGNTAIIPVNTQTVSKTITLPSVQTNPGRVIIIKDNTGNSATNNIFISTTGLDTLDKTFSVNTILSTSYGAWIFTNDGINTWFLVENYMNTLTLQNRNLLAPFPPFTVGLSVVENTFISTWTASINAVSYSVSYYSTTIPQASGGTLLQTVQADTALTNTLVQSASVGLYYYAVVTATNTNNSRTTTSLVVLPNLFPSTPTNIGLSFTTSSLICSWTPTLNTVSYTIVFYQNTSQSITGSSLIQAITGLTVPFYTLTTNIIQNLYYYTTVQAVNLSALSPAVQSPYVISTIYPSPVTLLTILVYANNTLCRWQPAINATSYSVAFYQNATPTTSGGSLIETVTTPSAFQASSAVLTNGNYIYAIVTSLNQYGTSTTVTTPFTTTAITVPPVQPTSFMSGNATATWSAITNATSYTVFFYQTTTPLASGGTLFYSAGSTASTTLTCAATLVNGYYYYATVQANNIYGSYPPRESQNTTAIIQNAPQPPSLVSISKVGTYLLASWTAGLNATSYTIIFYQNDTATTTGGSVFDTKTGQISTSQLSTINLINGKYYYATVQSINQYGSSTATTSATSTTQIIGTIPSAPSNVVISISGVNTVVTWTASANATTYSVTIFQNDTPSTLSGTLIESYNGLVSTSQTSSSILLNGKYYYAKVNAKNIYGSSYDVTTANTTAAISNAPQPPTNVSLVQNGTYFIASWAAAINATSYNITFYQNNSATTTGGSVFETTNGNTGTTQTSSTLLLNGKYYYVTVISVSSYNSLTSATITSLFSSPAVTGINPSPTTSASIVLSGVNTLVTWNTAPNATSYIVTFYQNSSAILTGGTIIETFTPGQAAITQTSSYILRNGTYIYATVISVNIYNNSVAVLTTTTTAAVSNAPQPPTNVSIVQSGTSVVASWTGAINATSYNIIFYQNNTATTTGGSTTQIFSYTNATQTWTAPTGVTSISVTMTGGGGGGGGSVPGPGALGGTGGYLSGTLTVTPGTTYTIYVGGGGVGALNSPAFTAGGFGGGGSSAGGNGNTAGGGGGATYILNGSTLIVAVGGGGGGGYFSYMTGGNGGGQTGGNGGAPYNGTGGTQLAGGTVGLGGAGGTGSYLQGGNASDYYGGGGGGYYGGGAGLGGGGGSDYSTSLTNITQTQGGGATGGSGALALSSNKGVNGGNGSITILVSTKAPFETDNGNTGTSQSSSTILLNTYYYYATVTSFSSYNSLSSPIITSGSTTSAITGINPSPTSTALITLSGVNTLVSWSVAPNAISYTILLYQTATQTVSGGSLVETISGQVLTSQTTSYILRNGTYYYASITSVNIYNNSSAVLTTTTTAAVSNAPQPPTNVSIVQSGTSVVASWTGAINATSYTIIFYQNNTATTTGGSTFETDNGNTGTSQNSSTLLLNGKYYYVTVTSFTSYNSTTSSAITSSTTTAAITGINPSPTTSASITLSGVNTLVSWSAAPNATSYTILLYETATQTVSGGTLVETDSGQVSTTQTTSYILRNGKYYYASVTSVNIYNNSSAVLTTTSTTAVSNAPQPPTNVAIVQSGTSVVASWTAAINATSYNIIFYQNNTAITSGGSTFETDNGNTGTSQNSSTLLLNGKYYYATVTSFSSYNSTTSSAITSSTTTAAITGINPSPTTSASITLSGVNTLVSWSAAPNATSYNILLYETATQTVSGGSLVETISGQVSTTQTTSYILRNGKYYYASVISVNIYNNSVAVLTTTSTTAASNAPQPPTNITVTFSGSVLSSSWTAAINATSYNVSFYYGPTNTTSGGTFVETDSASGTTQNLVAATLGGYYYYTTVTTVSSYNSTTSSTITSTNAAQITVAPSAPTNVAVSMSGYYGVCTWTTASNTTTYTVAFYSNSTATTSGGTLLETTTLLANNTTTKTATTLTPNNTYVYAIVTGVNGYASTSTTSATTTSLNQFAPTNPSNVTVSFSGVNVAVSWTASSFYTTAYTVILYNNGTTNSTSGGTAVETTSGVTGTSRTTAATLVSGNYYYATVTATNAIPLSSSVITSSSAILANIIPIGGGAITFNSITGLTSGSITITQTAQYATGYKVYISTTTSSANYVFLFTTTTTGSAVSFSGASFVGNTTYYAVLVPYASGGDSASNSFSSGITTLPLPTGGSVTINSLSGTGGNITFTPANLATSHTMWLSRSTSTADAVYSTTINAAFFKYTGADQSYRVPTGVTSMSVFLWGAGGTTVSDYGNGGTGGPGGYVSGTLATVSAETLVVVAPASGPSQYGGGGGNNQGYSPAYGGGRAAIRRGAADLVTAGGGGGAGYTSQGGAGGGLVGGNGSTGGGYNEPWGIGGSQSVGGGRSDNAALSKGGQYYGGNPQITSSGNYMGGGGSGWYGGGGGAGGSSGGGGSSYVGGITGATNTQGGGMSQNTNGQVVIYNGAVSFSGSSFTFSFSTTVSTGFVYYIILLPSNTYGNGNQYVSPGRAF